MLLLLGRLRGADTNAARLQTILQKLHFKLESALQNFSEDPTLLKFDVDTYKKFRDARLNRIWEIAAKTVNPELTNKQP